MREYPKGAISSINELLTHAGTTLYRASRKHSQGNPEALVFTGAIHSKQNEFKKAYYHGFQIEEKWGCHWSSLKDMNIIENGYNDWFVFAQIEDAQAYLA